MTKHRTYTGSRLLTRLRRLGRDKKGVGAVEFAIVAPVLLMVYIGAFESSLGFTMARKVARASSTVADIFSQESSLTASKIDSADAIARSILAPFEGASLSYNITGIKVSSGAGTVEWSRNEKKQKPYTKGTTVTLPAGIAPTDGFIIRTEMVVPHELLLFAPGLLPSEYKTINLSRTSYFLQRSGESISCADC